MMDFLNRRDVYSNTNVPHVVKEKKRVLEEKNTIVVKHKRKSIIQKTKEMFGSQSVEDE